MRYVYADSAKEVFTAGLGGREKKIKERGKKEEDGTLSLPQNGQREEEIMKYQAFVKNRKIKMGGAGREGGWGGGGFRNCV